MGKDRKWKGLLLSILAVALVALVAGCSDEDKDSASALSAEEVNFASSLHGTRAGKDTWYNDETGFGSVVDVAYADLPCADCHNKVVWEDAGLTYEEPNCLDCHEAEAGDAVAMPDTCYGCHSRQKTEMALGLTDVHGDDVDDDGDGTVNALGCMDCHSSGDVHGDGTVYDSMLAPGAIDAKCENCHDATELAGVNDYHDAGHMDAIDCSACHMESVITCYNCHFDNEAIDDGSVLHAKFASAKFGGPGEKSWRYLVNRVIDKEGNTKIFPGSMQTLVADVTAAGDGADDGQGKTFVGIGPYYSHSIKRNAITCQDCHASAALQQYVDTGSIDVVKWNGADGEVVPVSEMGSKWQAPKGVIPVPPDFAQALKFEFIDLVDPTAALNAAGTSSSARVAFKRQADAIHLLDKYVRPLSEEQMASLGWFATSLHGTRLGKETFYDDGLGEASPAALQAGFGNFVDVSYDQLPCVDCHNAAAWTDADTDEDTWPGNPVCADCHGSENPAADPAVADDTCKGCHSRLGAEAAIGLTDLHRDVLDMVCADCHGFSDVHGTGEKLATMFEGAITANCQNQGCHDLSASTTLEHGEHLDNIDCSTCHMQSVVTCYNCHFDNEAIEDGSVLHAKFASAKFGGPPGSGKEWRFLVNRVLSDGTTKVFPGSMQSLMADVTASNFPGEDGQGTTFVAIAPYYSHSITRVDALTCTACHGTATATAIADGTPVDVVKWNAAAGVEVPASSMGATWQGPSGIIPVPEDTSLLRFDFIDLVDPAAALTPTGTSSSSRVLFKNGADAIHMPSDYVRPLADGQLGSLKFLHNTTLDCAFCHPRN
jgi:hypothetical protein